MSEETAPEKSPGESAAALEVTPEQPEPSVEELQQQLAEARQQAEDHWSQALRLQAEVENGRRRAERDVASAHKYALERFSQDLLPVCDSLEMALGAIGEGAGLEQLREGTELTLKMLLQAMEKYGISQINPLQEAFNPELHQAMSVQESVEAAPNTVLMVMQKGYLLNERLIRPALVVVAKAPTDAGIESGDKDPI